jgi:hypothetical protein
MDGVLEVFVLAGGDGSVVHLHLPPDAPRERGSPEAGKLDRKPPPKPESALRPFAAT